MAETKIQNTDNTYYGVYPTVFKKIDSADVKVTPFQAFKSWTIYSGSITSSMLPLQGIYTDVNYLPAIDSELVFNDASNIDGSLQSITYFSINHLFYKRKNQPANTFGPTDLNRSKKFLYQTASIISIPQVKIGEGIKPSSFVLTSSVSGSYASDRYGNLYNVAYDTASIVTGVKFYEGFNEYFDTSRITYQADGVTYDSGIPTTSGRQLPLGLAAKFNGAGYIESKLDGFYDRDHDYAISFFISSSASGTTNQLVLTKASSSLVPSYPFKIEVSGSKQLVFSAAGSTTFTAQISSSTAVSSSWTHVVCQKTGSSLQMYINGTLQSSTTNTLLGVYDSPFTASARIDNGDVLKIGGYSINSFNLQGLIDEVRIFNNSLNASQISALNNRNEDGTVLQTQYVGNVFSKQGIVVFSSPDYRVNDIIKTPFTASYRSTMTINEFSTVAKLDAGDFNMSTNLSLTKDDDSTFYPFVSGSTFSPYITTIGLYNDFGELLAVAKLAQPIKKRNDVDMNFLIRIDLDKNIVFKG